MINYFNKSQPSNFFFCENIEDGSRNIAIILNKKVKLQGKDYLEIVGLDIATCRIVKLVDSFGLKHNLCSFSQELYQHQKSSVLKVPCKLVDPSLSANTFRVVGNPQLLGKTNFIKLMRKYESCAKINANYTVPTSFVYELANYVGEKEFYIQIAIKSLIKKHIRKDNSAKYQIKIESTFADIDFKNRYFSPADHENELYTGIGLLKIKKPKDNVIIKIVDLQTPGRFYKSEEEYRKYHSYKYLNPEDTYSSPDDYGMPIENEYDDYDFEDIYGIDYADWDERDDQEWLEELDYSQDVPDGLIYYDEYDF